MKSRLVVTVHLVVVLLLVASCTSDSGRAPGIEDAGPPIARFAAAGKALQGFGAAIAQTGDDKEIPSGFGNRLEELGTAARAVVARAEPGGPAGVAAIQHELATVATDVIRHLATAEGGTEDGPNRLLSTPPQQVAFAVNVPARPLDADRSEKGKAKARSRLEADLSLEIEHFLYAALLANSAARSKFCVRCTPKDLPKDVDPALNMPFATTEEWRKLLFDDDNRLVLPSPFDDPWVAFQGWTTAVNPILADAVFPSRQLAFDRLYL